MIRIKSWSLEATHTNTIWNWCIFQLLVTPNFFRVFFFQKKARGTALVPTWGWIGFSILATSFGHAFTGGRELYEESGWCLGLVAPCCRTRICCGPEQFGSSAGSRPTRKKTIWFLFCYRSTYMLYVICYMLYVICYMLYVICYMLYVICFML